MSIRYSTFLFLGIFLAAHPARAQDIDADEFFSRLFGIEPRDRSVTSTLLSPNAVKINIETGNFAHALGGWSENIFLPDPISLIFKSDTQQWTVEALHHDAYARNNLVSTLHGKSFEVAANGKRDLSGESAMRIRVQGARYEFPNRTGKSYIEQGEFTLTARMFDTAPGSSSIEFGSFAKNLKTNVGRDGGIGEPSSMDSASYRVSLLGTDASQIRKALASGEPLRKIAFDDGYLKGASLNAKRKEVNATLKGIVNSIGIPKIRIDEAVLQVTQVADQPMHFEFGVNAYKHYGPTFSQAFYDLLPDYGSISGDVKGLDFYELFLSENAINAPYSHKPVNIPGIAIGQMISFPALKFNLHNEALNIDGEGNFSVCSTGTPKVTAHLTLKIKNLLQSLDRYKKSGNHASNETALIGQWTLIALRGKKLSDAEIQMEVDIGAKGVVINGKPL